MQNNLKEEIVNEIGRLDYENQRRVLYFAKGLASASIKGVSGKRLLSFAGLMPREDLGAIERAIEEHCEKVDHNEW